MNYLKQSLVEYQTKLDAFQVKLDSYYGEYPICKSDENEWNRLATICQRLRDQINNEGKEVCK